MIRVTSIEPAFNALIQRSADAALPFYMQHSMGVCHPDMPDPFRLLGIYIFQPHCAALSVAYAPHLHKLSPQNAVMAAQFMHAAQIDEKLPLTGQFVQLAANNAAVYDAHDTLCDFVERVLRQKTEPVHSAYTM